MVVKCEKQFGMEVVYVTKRKKAKSVEQKLVTLELLSMLKQFTHIERSYVRKNGEIKNVLRLMPEVKL